MKGTTHLAIGIAIGAVTAAQYPFSPKSTSLYLAVSAFSALSADLDGPSMLSSKISKLSRSLRNFLLWSGFIATSILIYQYFSLGVFYPEYTAASLALFMLGLLTSEGMLRNTLISGIGGGFIYAALLWQMPWLLGLGVFIAIAPWLKHRGMTHTVWAVIAWGLIGQGLEQQLQLPGMMTAATLGYLSHLIADTLTPSGVKWLYPIYKKPFKLP
ncbi:metal-dependent hydrolase [Paenibacillus sp. YPG26]|uniref:metal-dependent hydrolase n=1 Tax=Paenibacillus sp. YPG26 TaxID=2878915 RepID=UPI002040213B|nr:metal-dependent hydrolase [Paenibacillus sp. YPG26]USB32175.1 metal-dependent hydrolase [Paenibacillus sp. YPG26]